MPFILIVFFNALSCLQIDKIIVSAMQKEVFSFLLGIIFNKTMYIGIRVYIRVVGDCRVIYDRVQNKKNNFEITAFLNYERGTSRAGNSKSNENKNVFVFIWCFEFSRSWFSSFNLKKGGNFKIIFPFPYPIIYNPAYYYLKP